ncbi:excalibur calcium-binding domain-containing protein [Actinomyces sp.]
MRKSMMISLTAACAAWVLSGCFGGLDSSTGTVVPQSPTPIAATTPTFKATTRTPRSTPSVIRVSPSPSTTTEASVHAVPRETEPTSQAAPPPPPREEAAPAPQREAAAPAPAPVQEQSSVYYKNCQAARDAGAAPLYRGNPGYRSELDRDGDGIACERSKKKHH